MLRDSPSVRPECSESFLSMVEKSTQKALDVTYAKQPDLAMFRAISDGITSKWNVEVELVSVPIDTGDLIFDAGDSTTTARTYIVDALTSSSSPARTYIIDSRNSNQT